MLIQGRGFLPPFLFGSHFLMTYICNQNRSFPETVESEDSEIKTGERRVIEFFISPFIKYVDESLTLR